MNCYKRHHGLLLAQALEPRWSSAHQTDDSRSIPIISSGELLRTQDRGAFALPGALRLRGLLAVYPVPVEEPSTASNSEVVALIRSRRCFETERIEALAISNRIDRLTYLVWLSKLSFTHLTISGTQPG